MIIDSHQHFWKYAPLRDSWIDDSMKILQKDFLPNDLYPELLENRIDGTIAVQADQSETETNFLLNLAEQNDWIRGVVGWVDLRDRKIEERLEYFSGKSKLLGFRHIIQSEPDDNFMLDDKFQNGIGLLKKYNFTYDILVYPNQLSATINLVNNHPEQIFILDHIGKPLIKSNIFEPWASDIKRLAENNNVYCKISGIVTEADYRNWSNVRLFPFLDIVFNAFGVDRIMFGSDWPVCLLSGTYKQVKKIIEDYTKDFSKTEILNLFGGNAVKAYGNI